MDQDKKGEKVEQNLLQDCLSGETNDEKNQRAQDQHPGQESLSGESEIDEKVSCVIKQFIVHQEFYGLLAIWCQILYCYV